MQEGENWKKIFFYISVLSKLSLASGGLILFSYCMFERILPDVVHTVTISELLMYGLFNILLLTFFTIFGAFLSYPVFHFLLWFSAKRRARAAPEQKMRYYVKDTNNVFANTKGEKSFILLIAISICAISMLSYLLFLRNIDNNYHILLMSSYVFITGFLFVVFTNACFDRESKEFKSRSFLFIPLLPLAMLPVLMFVNSAYLTMIGLRPRPDTKFFLNEEAAHIVRLTYHAVDTANDECTIEVDGQKESYFPKLHAVLYGIGDFTFFETDASNLSGSMTIRLPTKDLYSINGLRSVSCRK